MDLTRSEEHIRSWCPCRGAEALHLTTAADRWYQNSLFSRLVTGTYVREESSILPLAMIELSLVRMFRNNSDLLFVSLFFPLSSGYSPIFAVIREYDRSTESEDGQMPNQETLQVVEIIRHPNYSSKYSHDVSSRPASKLSLQILSTVQVSSTTLLLYFYLAIPLIGILLNFFFFDSHFSQVPYSAGYRTTWLSWGSRGPSRGINTSSQFAWLHRGSTPTGSRPPSPAGAPLPSV